MPEFIKTIAKKYPDYVKYLDYHKAWYPNNGQKDRKQKKIIVTAESLKHVRSALRAKAAIHDIAACNDFDFFVTFTFSKASGINRYDYSECSKKLSIWLKYHLSQYLLVPEKHKDGAYHFHALANFKPNQLKHLGGGVYSIQSFKLGRTNVTKIKDRKRVARYITKYISKDLMSTVSKGKKTYWASRNLNRPEVQYNVPIPTTATHVFSAEHLDVYTEQHL